MLLWFPAQSFALARFIFDQTRKSIDFLKIIFNVILIFRDNVPNVRQKATWLLPDLKRVIVLPVDVTLLERLNSANAFVLTDMNAEVSRVARTIQLPLKQVPIRVTGIVGGQSLSASGNTDNDLAKLEVGQRHHFHGLVAG